MFRRQQRLPERRSMVITGSHQASTLIERVEHDPLQDERIGNCLPLAPREPRL
jgi:hypothetical protein